jgi:chaperone BCS1
LARSHDILNHILIDSKKEYQEAQKNFISVYVPNQQSWRVLGTRSKRAFSSIILDPGMKDVLIDDAKDFLSSKAWYAARGIPFRRGYLLVSDPFPKGFSC